MLLACGLNTTNKDIYVYVCSRQLVTGYRYTLIVLKYLTLRYMFWFPSVLSFIYVSNIVWEANSLNFY